MKVNVQLYIELLEAEVKRQKQENYALELRLKAKDLEQRMVDNRPRQERAGAVAGLVGLTPSKAAEAIAAGEVYTPPRGLGDGPSDDGLMAKTRADLAKGDGDAD